MKDVIIQLSLVALGTALASIVVRIWVVNAPSSAATVGLGPRQPTGSSSS